MTPLTEWLLWAGFAVLFLGVALVARYLFQLYEERKEARLSRETNKEMAAIRKKAQADVKRREQEIKEAYRK